MKKLMMTMLVGMLAAMTLAQNVQFSKPADTFMVTPVVLRAVEKEANWRTGLFLPLFDAKQNQRSFARVGGLVLTDTKKFEQLYLGAGLSVPIWQTRNLDLALTGGWSAKFPDLTKARDAKWGVGAALTVRF